MKFVFNVGNLFLEYEYKRIFNIPKYKKKSQFTREQEDSFYVYWEETYAETYAYSKIVTLQDEYILDNIIKKVL